MNKTEILNLPMGKNDADAETLGDYLKALLTTLWREGESFSGKRPWGNSGWEYDIYQCLVSNNAVPGSLDDEGYLDSFDEKKANALIFKTIEDLF